MAAISTDNRQTLCAAVTLGHKTVLARKHLLILTEICPSETSPYRLQSRTATRAIDMRSQHPDVKALLLPTTPAGQLQWGTAQGFACEWRHDAAGSLHADVTEGTGHRRYLPDAPTNIHHVEIWLYAHVDDTSVGTVDASLALQFARILANTSRPMSPRESGKPQ